MNLLINILYAVVCGSILFGCSSKHEQRHMSETERLEYHEGRSDHDDLVGRRTRLKAWDDSYAVCIEKVTRLDLVRRSP